MNKVYFTSDLHFSHRNIMKYCPNRVPLVKEWARQHGVIVTQYNLVECMDNWLIDLWNSQVDKTDTVYVLGDFSFNTAENNKKILSKLKGKKFLILGNHDGNSEGLDKLKATLSHIYDLVSSHKSKDFTSIDEANDFLKDLNTIVSGEESIANWFEQISQIKEYKFKDESGETFCFEMCHYPMVSWNRKEHGTMNIHGHCHGNLDWFNNLSSDLRVDVGLDGKFANYRFVTPDDILLHFYHKAGTKDLAAYNTKHSFKHKLKSKVGIITKISNFIHGK